MQIVSQHTCSNIAICGSFDFPTIFSHIFSSASFPDFQHPLSTHLKMLNTTTQQQPFFTALYPGLPGWAGTRRNTHPPTIWSSSNLYQLLLSTTIHSILLVQITCLAIFLHNLFPCPLWSGALYLIFHTFLHPISVIFSQHIPIPSQHGLL